ncbi:MAG: GNAT family N-acetyltransferase [Prevotellaceae bacterium]|jgi:GNAT superfamily N-acetyltransferase|nr:GNAT family N-acetyltransferase [Prevotellaceae bacterium]
MKTERLPGTDKRLYELVAPYAMNRKVIAEFDGYPILTGENYCWFIIFDDDGNLSGFSAIRQTQTDVEFTFDYVIPEYRKNGIHKKLISERIKWCKKNGITHIKADCTNECLPHYLKSKFKIVKEFSKWHKVELML